MTRSSTIAVLLVAWALVACDVDENPVAQETFCREVLPRVAAFMERARLEHPTPEDPRYGGTVVVGATVELVGGMNAATSQGYRAMEHQAFVNLMTLIDYDEALSPRPYLAQSWEVAEDRRSITFHLRRDVLWHDGERTDAHDVAFTYEVVTDPRTAFPTLAYWDHYVKGPEGVEVLDDFTVRIRLEPHADFLDPFRATAILPEHLLGDVPRNDLAFHPFGTQCPVGNGPFVFVEHALQERWVFEANPAFPSALGGRPRIDRYVYRVISEQATLLAELLTERIDVYLQPSADQAPTILERADLELRSHRFREYVYIAWNARRPQLADARVRRALTMAIDRALIVRAIGGGYGVAAHSTVPPFHWAYDPGALPVLPYDPDGARMLLDEAGWRDRDGDGVRESAQGMRLSITLEYGTGSRQRQDIAEIVQAMLAAVGVEAVPRAIELATLLERMNTPGLRDFDGALTYFIPDLRLDDTDVFHSARASQPFATTGVTSPEIDRLLESITLATDREEGRALWREYQTALIAEQPYTFVFFPDRLIGVNRRVRGAVMDVRGELVNLREWYLEEASRP